MISMSFCQHQKIGIKKTGSALILVAVVLSLFCAASQSHRLRHGYSVPQALRFVRQILIDRGYRIAVFDTASGIIRTERKDHTAEDGSTVTHQISVTVVTADELLIKVLPASVRRSADRIMEPLVESLQTMGFRTERDITSPSNP